MSAPDTSPAVPPRSEAPTSLAAALGAFLLWGIAPLYFKAIDQVGPVEILAHRIVWTVLMLGALVPLLGLSHALAGVLTWRRLRIFFVTTALISTNWLIFIWAVINDHVLQASLGYFINPLVNVLLGVAFLRERLNRRQLVAVALAGIGVGNLVVGYGTVPWVSLALAFSFGFYALVRKTAAADPLVGLVVETGLLAPAALLYLIVLGAAGGGSFVGAVGAERPVLDEAGLAVEELERALLGPEEV